VRGDAIKRSRPRASRIDDRLRRDEGPAGLDTQRLPFVGAQRDAARLLLETDADVDAREPQRSAELADVDVPFILD
jgi:hypothetical protein